MMYHKYSLEYWYNGVSNEEIPNSTPIAPDQSLKKPKFDPIAQTWIEGSTLEELAKMEREVTAFILKNNVEFGKTLINEYLLDNMVIPQNFTIEERFQMITQFNNIKLLLEIGDISTSLLLLENTPIDAFFTLDRKIKYIVMVYLFQGKTTEAMNLVVSTLTDSNFTQDKKDKLILMINS